MSLAPLTRLGPYEILARLGAGAMGEVYRARDTRLGREVAIKILPADLSGDPGRRARFEQEARAVAALNHPTSSGCPTSGTTTMFPISSPSWCQAKLSRPSSNAGLCPSRD